MSPEFAAFKERHDRACQAGLVAAAELYSGAIKDKLQHGYTSGDFVTGNAAASVNTTPPFEDDGGWAIKVGTNEMYLLFWETGHINLFTRKYERVEHWRAAMEEQGEAMRSAFAAAYQGIMGASA